MTELSAGERIADYDFDLPEELIALRPAQPRSDARLLVVRGASGTLEDHTIADLPGFLRADDVIVLNTTRVIPAALQGLRLQRDASGSAVKVTINLNRRVAQDRWSVFLRPAKRVHLDDVIQIGDGLTATVATEPKNGECELRFNLSGAALEAAINEVGETPLPPYILSRRAADAQDRVDYQTSYADAGESVAAPTAGLHLSAEILGAIAGRGTKRASVRLDVNAGTFRPVMTDMLDDHRMHAERAVVSSSDAAMINGVRHDGGRCVAVGTTAMRTLESAGKLGRVEAYDGDTSIFIRPGHTFQVCDGLLTNFHLPRSTLFVLVSAFMGRSLMLDAYRHAIRERYRFFSYGDACLLLPDG